MVFSNAKRPISAVSWFVLLLTVCSAIYAVFFWAKYLGQPLVDMHSFRQTQTALSAYYLFKDGTGLLDYQTPVIGYPWSVPFEFPTFQLVVAGFQRLAQLELTTTGRAVSVFFGLGSLGVGLKILHLFKVSANGLGLFAILYLVSPIYLYWNRTFMIESTALFFSLLTLFLYWKMKNVQSQLFTKSPRLGGLAALLLSLILALVTKATTALPILLFIAVDLGLTVVYISRQAPRQTFLCLFRQTAPLFGILIAALLVLKAWTHHADQLKAANLIGTRLTSSALAGWNFGIPMMRLSRELWHEVVFNRMLTPYGWLPIGILLLIGTFKSPGKRNVRYLLVCFMVLAFAPLLIFTNLHVIHKYYQCANQVFVLLALATAGSTMLDSSRWTKALAAICVTVIVSSFLHNFAINYIPSMQKESSDQLTVGKEVRKNTRPGDAILVFGDDWSSAITFHSERKSLTVPSWPSVPRGLIFADSSRLLGGMPLGAIVLHNEDLAASEGDKVCPTHHSSRLNPAANWLIYKCLPLDS